MTMWVLQDEENVGREYIRLPFRDIPDLSQTASAADVRRMLMALHPDAPPETIASLLERSWKFYQEIAPEDMVVVPMESRKALAIACITGPYRYDVAEDGSDAHLFPVKWENKTIPFSALRNHKSFLEEMSPLYEITDVETRKFIHARLPKPYNRFVAIKWIVGLLLGLQAISFLLQMLKN